jgi:thiamine pyrophosphokinase
MLEINNFKSFICLSGNLPSVDFFRSVINLNIPVIAADGAATKLMNIGVDPTFIIGDMDSFFGKANDDTEIIVVEDQNYTDFEKAIMFVKERNLEPCLILGMNGGEIDHILNNIATFVRYSTDVDMWFYDILDLGRAKIGRASSRFEYDVNKGSTISLFSFDHGQIVTEGMVWEIDSQPFHIMQKSAARNCAKSEKITISTSGDKVLTIIEANFTK